MQKQIQKPVREQTQQEKEAEATTLAEEDTEKQTEIREKAKDVLDVTDDLLDEIDALLEEQAEEFVAAFRQRGGQ